MLDVLKGPVFAALRRQQRLPRQIVPRRVRESRRVQECGQQIIEVHQSLIHGAGLQLPRPAQQKRNLTGGVIRQEFLVRPQISQHLAVVAGEYHQSVLRQAQRLQFRQNPADLAVGKGDGAGVQLPHPLDGSGTVEPRQALVLFGQG